MSNDLNDLWYCPENVRESLERYRDHHIPTGGFLEAVLSNDLREAISRADDTNIRHIPGIVRWIYWKMPSPAWGSPEAFTGWVTGFHAIKPGA